MRSFPILPTTLVALATACLVCPTAQAEDELDEEQVATYAVQSRVFRLGGELTVVGGILPINAFNKGLTVGGSFTYHFTHSWAWEVIQGGYVYKQLDTGLKKELLENFSVNPTDISALSFMLSTNGVWTPFYGKLAVMNRGVIHLDTSLLLGLAWGQYINPKLNLLGPNVGIIFRVFVSPHVSFCLGVRDYVFINHDRASKEWKTRQEVHVSLGAAFAWGGDER